MLPKRQAPQALLLPRSAQRTGMLEQKHMKPARKVSFESILWVSKASSELAPGAEVALKAQEMPASAASSSMSFLLARAGASNSRGAPNGREPRSTC